MLRSIIWADRPPTREALMPSFFIDLNLDQIVYKINSLRKNYDVKKLYYMLPDSEESLLMRRNIYEDISNEKVFECFMAYSDEMYHRKRCFLLRLQTAIFMLLSFCVSFKGNVGRKSCLLL